MFIVLTFGNGNLPPPIWNVMEPEYHFEVFNRLPETIRPKKQERIQNSKTGCFESIKQLIKETDATAPGKE